MATSVPTCSLNFAWELTVPRASGMFVSPDGWVGALGGTVATVTTPASPMVSSAHLKVRLMPILLRSGRACPEESHQFLGAEFEPLKAREYFELRTPSRAAVPFTTPRNRQRGYSFHEPSDLNHTRQGVKALDRRFLDERCP